MSDCPRCESPFHGLPCPLPESMLMTPGFDIGPDEGVEFVELVDCHDDDELSW